MSPLLVDLTAHLSSSHPLPSLSFFALSITPILFPLCFTSTHLPDRLLPHSIILIFLLSSFHSWLSVHHSRLSYLSSLEWVLLENVPLEEMTGNRRCLASSLPVCSQGTGKAPLRVLTPQGCAVTGWQERNVLGKRKAMRESAAATGRWPWAF